MMLSGPSAAGRELVLYVDRRTRTEAASHYRRDGGVDDADWVVSFFSMPKDIFPAVNIPEVNLVWYYPGMSAPEIEQRIVNITERAPRRPSTD